MMTLMRNGSGPSIGKTRFVPREERTRACDWDRSADHIRARGHNGCIQRPDTWLHPNVSRTRQILFPCTAGAVHTCTAGAVHTWHGPEVPSGALYDCYRMRSERPF